MAKHSDNPSEGFKIILQGRDYPKDNEFRSRFKETKFYGAGTKQIKTKLILETLEESFAHKEAVPYDNLTIEHVMPQTLSEWWQAHLGQDWEITRDLYLHTIGNLTLTGYNTELSNGDFETKKKIYNDSHLEINKYFSPLTSWTRTDIEKRAEVLAEQAIAVWSYFGQGNPNSTTMKEVTGTTPKELKILGQQFQVQSWRDVLEQTLDTIAYLEPDKFKIIADNFPRYLGKDAHSFRATRQLQNGYFIEVNLSAENIRKFCNQAMETIELTSDEWNVVSAKQEQPDVSDDDHPKQNPD
ncbi:MAG: HNH endonuclease family protein [Dehalococcoidia bacterium]|nr:HNH endonuclease family protein [Dehalococcoidia bacterium]